MGVDSGLVIKAKAAIASARRFAVDFGRARRGNVAMIFALTLPVLVMLTMGGVDIHRASTVRANLQDALDAATLAAARSQAVTDADLKTVALKALKANLQNYPNITLREDLTTFHLNDDQIVVADAKVDVKTLVANIVLPPYGKLMDDKLPVGAHSEVNRSSKNIEVGLVLDITGSMSGNRITDLKAAAADLVDIVVQDVQSPYYTRMAVVPYSIGVNMGSYANGARGTPVSSVTITNAEWEANGPSRNLSNISRASPGVFTTGDPNGHGWQDGDFVWVSGVSGMTQVNNRAYRVKKISGQTFSLEYRSGSNWYALNTTSGNGYSSYSSGGLVRECLVSDCSIVVTANSHGIPATTSDMGSTQPGTVYITGVSGLTKNGSSLVNDRGFEVANVTASTFSIGVNGAGYSDYSSGGRSWCGQDGCQWRVFRNLSDNELTAFQTSSCVSERIGSSAYTDTSPSTAKVGRNYASSANPCPSATIQPLTSNKSTLKSLISGLTITGSTAGQIGLAWGWYSVSPNFNSLWSGNPAGAYNPQDTLKSVIMMTDGEFNTPYCTGVIAQDAGSGSGGSDDKVRCDATNGDPFEQATKLCDAMKAQNIIVYTVGFSITPGSDAAAILSNCATGPEYAFLPASGADLKDDFAAIGRDITRLRISK